MRSYNRRERKSSKRKNVLSATKMAEFVIKNLGSLGFVIGATKTMK